MLVTTKDEMREILKALLAEKDSRKGKTFVFPDNVDRSYNLVKGLSLANFIKFVLPAIIISAIILLISPYTLGFMMVKLLFVALLLLGSFTFAVLRPIASRPNITFSNYLKRIIHYHNRQKMFFIKPAKRDDFYE